MPGVMPGPNPEVFKGIVTDRANNLDREIGERAREREARRTAGKARGPLRTALMIAGITLIVFALVLAY